MSNLREMKIMEAAKRIAVVSEVGSVKAAALATTIRDCDAANDGDKRVVLVNDELEMNRNLAKAANFVPYTIHAMTGLLLGKAVRKLARPKPTKPCLECGEMHSHNNSWCSTGCCKTYKLKKKGEK